MPHTNLVTLALCLLSASPMSPSLSTIYAVLQYVGQVSKVEHVTASSGLALSFTSAGDWEPASNPCLLEPCPPCLPTVPSLTVVSLSTRHAIVFASPFVKIPSVEDAVITIHAQASPLHSLLASSVRFSTQNPYPRGSGNVPGSSSARNLGLP